MAAQTVHQSEFTLKLPIPTQEELSTIMKLKAEHVRLQDQNRLYKGIHDVMSNQFEFDYIKDGRIHQENAQFDPVSNCALPGAGAKSLEDFLVHLVEKRESLVSKSFNYQELLLDFSSLIQFSDSQPHKGAEVFDIETSSADCGSFARICVVELGGTLASESTNAAGTPRSELSLKSCGTSRICHYPVNHQNLKQSEPDGIQMPIQRRLPMPASALPALPEKSPMLAQCDGVVPMERLKHRLSPADTSMHQSLADAMTGRDQTTQGDLKQHKDAEDSQSEGHDLLLKSNNSTTCPPEKFSSSISAVTPQTNSPAAEGLRTLQSNQPESALAKLNSATVAHGLTTLVVRNVPSRYTKETLMKEWPADGTYDFLYLPFSFKQKRTAGYAFVNFTTHEAAVNFHTRWHRKSLHEQGAARKLSISVADIQGVEGNLRHLVHCNSISRTKNWKYLPSVFSGVDEVALEGLLDKMHCQLHG